MLKAWPELNPGGIRLIARSMLYLAENGTALKRQAQAINILYQIFFSLNIGPIAAA
jgi:hypothetical protein